MHGGTVGDGRGGSGWVESRLAAGLLGCPGCPGVLRPWGWARSRRVGGIGVVLRPRRARCAGCLVTQVLLPVTLLLRRAYAADVVGAAIVPPGAGTAGSAWSSAFSRQRCGAGCG